jgi:hypothetical protein
MLVYSANYGRKNTEWERLMSSRKDLSAFNGGRAREPCLPSEIDFQPFRRLLNAIAGVGRRYTAAERTK